MMGWTGYLAGRARRCVRDWHICMHIAKCDRYGTDGSDKPDRISKRSRDTTWNSDARCSLLGLRLASMLCDLASICTAVAINGNSTRLYMKMSKAIRGPREAGAHIEVSDWLISLPSRA